MCSARQLMFLNIILVICLMCVGVVSADENIIETTDGQFFQNDNYDWSGSTTVSTNIINQVYFNKIEAMDTFDGLKYYVNNSGPQELQVTNKVNPGNYSSAFVTLVDPATNHIYGVFNYGYFIDMNNHADIYLIRYGTWDRGGLTGARAVNITYTNPGTHIFDAQPLGVAAGGGARQTGTPTGDTQVYFRSSIAGQNIAASRGRIVEYTNNMYVYTVRLPGQPYDIFTFTRDDTLSNIKLQHYLNGSFISDFEDTSTNNSGYIYVPNNTYQKLSIINPITARDFYYSWAATGLMELNLNKTSVSTNEYAGGYLTVNDLDLFTRIEYYTDDNCDYSECHITDPSTPQVYKKVSGLWYRADSSYSGYPTLVSENEVLRVAFKSTETGVRTISVFGLDENDLLISKDTATITVLAAGTSNLDAITAIDAYNNAAIYPFYLTLTNANSSAVLFQGWRERPYLFNAETGKYYCASAYATGYYNNTYRWLQFNTPEGINIYLSSYQNLPSVTQWLFIVRDSTNIYPVSGVRITLSDNQTGTTDEDGRFTFIVPVSTLYTYKATKDGYVSVIGNTTTYGPTMITYIPMYIKLVTTTPVTPTATVTGLQISPSGLPIVNLANLILDVFQNFGLSATNARLFAGMFLVFSGAVIAAYLVPHPIIILSGGYAGFMLAILTGLWDTWIFVAVSAMAALAIAYVLIGRGGA